jgi:hypothetical protein
VKPNHTNETEATQGGRKAVSAAIHINTYGGGSSRKCPYLLRVIIKHSVVKTVGKSQSIQSSDHDNYDAEMVLVQPPREHHADAVPQHAAAARRHVAHGHPDATVGRDVGGRAVREPDVVQAELAGAQHILGELTLADRRRPGVMRARRRQAGTRPMHI